MNILYKFFVQANTQLYSPSLRRPLLLFQLCGTPLKLATVFILSVIFFKKGVTPTELKTKIIITFYKAVAPMELKTSGGTC